MTEAEIVLGLEKWLQQQGLQTNIEVPWPGGWKKGQRRMGPRWDLVAWNDGGRFLAIEAKAQLSVFAIDQAAAMMPACEEVYIGLPIALVERALRAWGPELRDYGIGLIGYGVAESEVTLPAANVVQIRSPMRDEMLRIAQSLPREGAEPGRRKQPTDGWRWRGLDTRERSYIGLVDMIRPIPRSSLRKRR